ncbi:MAG TPA: hypothetical protein VF035_05840 [Longimicrobiales bacterium]
MRRARLLAPLLASIVVAGCGYFNSLYNARLRFQAAEEAERQGNRSTAMTAYAESIDRAFVSYDKYPDSRWADDALLLIARARFARGETREAAAALERLLGESSDPEIRTQAFAYLGAARVKLGLSEAVPPLDSAVASTRAGSRFGSFSRLWRARARFAAGDASGGWQDLDEAEAGDAQLSAEARVEALARALSMRDSLQWLRTMPVLITDGTPPRWNDSVRALIERSAATWSPGFVSASLPADVGENLLEPQRQRLRKLRSELIAAAGDTAAAIEAALDVATASSSDVSAETRVLAARWMLASADSTDAVARARAVLLPAFSWAEALQLIHGLRTVDVLLSRAAEDPAALFVAAEYLRDDLRAPGIARNVFLRHAAQGNTWSGKSLLAALHLSVDEEQRAEVRRLLDGAEANVYVQIARGGGDAAAFEAAESLLLRESSALRAEAVALGVSGDLSVGRAVAVRDSIRLTLLRDSLMTRCAVLVDNVAAKGVRADSTRAACLRNDTARVNIVLRMDTMLLKPNRDSIPAAARPDTTLLR